MFTTGSCTEDICQLLLKNAGTAYELAQNTEVWGTMGPGIGLGGLIVSGVSYASLILLFRANKES